MDAPKRGLRISRRDFYGIVVLNAVVLTLVGAFLRRIRNEWILLPPVLLVIIAIVATSGALLAGLWFSSVVRILAGGGGSFRSPRCSWFGWHYGRSFAYEWLRTPRHRQRLA